MYYRNNFRNRSSIRHGGSQGFNRSSHKGEFNRPRSFNNQNRGPRRSKLEGVDINMFIKRASLLQQMPEQTISQQFSDFNIVDYLKVNIQNKDYTTPTPIQIQAIPAILEGRDLIGLANTGTGKTAAFLIPIVNKIFKDRNQKALIITPTRELAVQINDELKSFTANMSIYSALLIGGSNMLRQISDLRRNPHIVIGTPGRLKDLIERHQLKLNDFQTFVLDEVDLMVDIGFISEVKYFLSFLPSARQSLFFSATIPPKIRAILQAFVQNPVTVSVKQRDTAQNVDQNVVRVENPAGKIDQLHDLLIKEGFDKVLIFGRTKHGIEKLNKELTFRGFKTGALHGNKRQSQRKRTLDSFKRNEIQILLATDVASRGLDIENVTHVINYDLPQTYDDYIHRIGRTGRAGKTGFALTFVNAYSTHYASR
ncbi:DEAD/DEAH box helicase [Candidatus Microgenomates bacterium]|nr:DEAD/DEAH box helicase [Candidatus Microgenomates bacterium]